MMRSHIGRCGGALSHMTIPMLDVILHLNVIIHASLLPFVQTKKVVQTEVDPTTYTRLKHLADRRSVPLKALLRDALRSYVDVEEGRLEEDPIFRIVGSLKLAGRAWSERKDWRP